MATIKKNDFVEIEYTGTIKEEKTIFDTTREEVARKGGFHRDGARYGPLTVCVGEHFLLKGLDEYLVGKEIGKEYTVDLSAENAFGKKNAKLLQMIPANKFRQSKVQPVPGLQVNIDGTVGLIKTVSGGRVMVDLNHPLAGREISYTFKVISIIDDEKAKVDAYLKHMGLDELETKTENGVIILNMHSKVNEAIEKEFERKIKAAIPTIKEVKFAVSEKKEGATGHEHSHPHSHEGHTHTHSHSHEGHDHTHHSHKH